MAADIEQSSQIDASDIRDSSASQCAMEIEPMRFLLVSTTSLFLLTFTRATEADWSESFAGGNASQTWVFGEVPTGSNNTQTYSNGSVSLASELGVLQGGAAAVFGVVPELFSSTPGVRVRSVLNPTNDNLSRNIGVFGLFNPDEATGYSLTITFVGDGTLDLSRIDNESTIDGLASIAIDAFQATNTYIVELEAIGGALTGRVYDSSNNLLHEVFAEDSQYSGGYSGIIAQRVLGDATLLGTYGLTSSTTVPEPSSLLLLLIGCGMAGLCFRRRRPAGS